MQSLVMLTAALALRDDETGEHARRVTELALALRCAERFLAPVVDRLAAGPAVEMLRPPGGAVAELELEGAERGEVFEVASCGSAADAGPIGDLDRRDVLPRLTYCVEDERERRRGNSLRQRGSALGA